MRIHDFLAAHLDEVRDVIDLTGSDLVKQLRLPDSVRQVRRGLADATGADIEASSLVVVLLGPESPAHIDPDDLVPVLDRMHPGARALLLLAWMLEDLPHHRLLRTLTATSCQIIQASAVDKRSVDGVGCALLIERVRGLTPLPADRGDAQTRPAASEDGTTGDLTMLRLVNEHQIADLVVHALRRGMAEHEALLTDQSKLIAEYDRLLAERDLHVAELKARLAAAKTRLNTLKRSTTFRVGQAVVQGAQHPARAIVSVPRDLIWVWRQHRSRQAGASIALELRVVPIALPTGPGGAEPALITLTAPDDLIVPRRLAQLGLAGYERDAMACFLAATEVAGPGAVFDIGANVGIYAALAAALTRREVRAFEPTPSLVDVARAFAADNGLEYLTESLALGAQNGTATFYLSSSSDSSNSLAAGFRESSSRIEVPVETLDGYLARTGVIPAVLKIDTETTEPDVLAGAADSIARHRPWIICEVLAGRVEARLAEVLTPFGYHWYHITDAIPYQEATVIAGDRSYRNLMWLFAPQPPGDDFWMALRERTAALAECTAQRGAESRPA